MEDVETLRTNKAAYGMERTGKNRDMERWCDLLNESRKIETELMELKIACEVDRIIMPICPYCKTEMEPFDFHGYYDTFCGWECICEKIPNAIKQLGEYG